MTKTLIALMTSILIAGSAMAQEAPRKLETVMHDMADSKKIIKAQVTKPDLNPSTLKELDHLRALFLEAMGAAPSAEALKLMFPSGFDAATAPYQFQQKLAPVFAESYIQWTNVTLALLAKDNAKAVTEFKAAEELQKKAHEAFKPKDPNHP